MRIVVAQQTPRLGAEFWQALQTVRTSRTYAKGVPLFRRGSPADGLYVVESGEVRLLLPTGPDRQQLVELAGPGCVLGLAECMSGNDYRITAEASDYTAAWFVPRDALLQFLQDHREFSIQVVRLLSEDLHALYHKFRSISSHAGRPRRRSLGEQLS